MAKQKKRTGKRMGPGRPAVVVDEVRQRLFNKHFDEGYSADDLWKQNRDCISKRTAQRLVKDCQTTLDWRRSPPARRERSDGARRWVLEVLGRVVDERPAAYLDEIQREQLIFVDECHKSESLFASCSLSSSAKCSAHASTHARTHAHTHTRTHAPHTAMFLPWITDQGFAWCAVCRSERGPQA